MQSVISSGQTPSLQFISREWHGRAVEPPFAYGFSLSPQGLNFRAARAARALVCPAGRSGCFQPGLWRYDTAEFFIARPDASRYLEFNLSPNGAWWACVFSAPRVPDAALEGWRPQAQASGCCAGAGWECQALIPIADLRFVGIDPACCRLAACAILESPSQIFLTTAESPSGEPDFHLPLHWPPALCQMEKN